MLYHSDKTQKNIRINGMNFIRVPIIEQKLFCNA